MRTKLIIAAVAIALVAAVYFLFFRKKSPAVSTAKVGSQKVSGSPTNSIMSTALAGIKALTGSPSVKSDITFTDEEGEEDMAAASDDDAAGDLADLF